MDLRTIMVKVCAAVYLIYSFPAWCWKCSCECSRGYQNPVRILMSLAGMTDLQECHGCSWLQPLQIYVVSTVPVLS
jgi:hypothetical protein